MHSLPTRTTPGSLEDSGRTQLDREPSLEVIDPVHLALEGTALDRDRVLEEGMDHVGLQPVDPPDAVAWVPNAQKVGRKRERASRTVYRARSCVESSELTRI